MPREDEFLMGSEYLEAQYVMMPMGVDELHEAKRAGYMQAIRHLQSREHERLDIAYEFENLLDVAEQALTGVNIDHGEILSVAAVGLLAEVIREYREKLGLEYFSDKNMVADWAAKKPKKGHWASEPPTEPGYYWCRFGTDQPELEIVRANVLGELFVVDEYDPENILPVETYSNGLGQWWSEPVQPPSEGK